IDLNPAFFFNLAYSRFFHLLIAIDLTFWQVPFSKPVDKEVVSFAVLDQPPSRLNSLDFFLNTVKKSLWIFYRHEICRGYFVVLRLPEKFFQINILIINRLNIG